VVAAAAVVVVVVVVFGHAAHNWSDVFGLRSLK
jgi:hypothetical protein